MIKSLKIEGFEACKSVKVNDLHKGLNVFIGESDKGKSTVVRSSKWVDENRPQGDSFRNTNLSKKKSVKVTQTFYDGQSITREKSASKNQYILPDGSILKALRSSVPTEVQQVTRMKAVNIQSQHPKDQYFMLTESPGQVAKMFNEVAGLAIMDRAMSEINKRVRLNSTALQLIEKDIEENLVTLKDLEWTEQATKSANEFRKLSKTIRKDEESVSELRQILTSYKDVKKQIKKYKHLDDAKQALSLLMKEEKELRSRANEIQKMEMCLNSLKENNVRLKAYDGTGDAQKELKGLLKAQESIESDQRDVAKLNQTLSRMADNAEDLKESKLDFNSYKKKFNKLLAKTQCPICGRKGSIK